MSQEGQDKFMEIEQKLLKFGYFYNGEGVLRTKDNLDFQFKNQQHYNTLGDIVLSYIQCRLQNKEFGMKEVMIPEHMINEDKCNIYISQDFYENQNGCIIMLCGAPPVLAGQWARSVCINNSLETGAVFPLVREANRKQWSSIVLNPNKRIGESLNKIPFCQNSQQHCFFVWEHYIKKCPAKNIYIVAHSAGGYNMMQLMNLDFQTFKNKVRAIAFTDACVWKDALKSKEAVQFLAERTINFVTSDKPAGTVLQVYDSYYGCAKLSAGHNKHEYTTGFATPEIIKFFNDPQRYMENSQTFQKACLNKDKEDNSQEKGQEINQNQSSKQEFPQCENQDSNEIKISKEEQKSNQNEKEKEVQQEIIVSKEEKQEQVVVIEAQSEKPEDKPMEISLSKSENKEAISLQQPQEETQVQQENQGNQMILEKEENKTLTQSNNQQEKDQNEGAPITNETAIQDKKYEENQMIIEPVQQILEKENKILEVQEKQNEINSNCQQHKAIEEQKEVFHNEINEQNNMEIDYQEKQELEIEGKQVQNSEVKCLEVITEQQNIETQVKNNQEDTSKLQDQKVENQIQIIQSNEETKETVKPENTQEQNLNKEVNIEDIKKDQTVEQFQQMGQVSIQNQLIEQQNENKVNEVTIQQNSINQIQDIGQDQIDQRINKDLQQELIVQNQKLENLGKEEIKSNEEEKGSMEIENQEKGSMEIENQERSQILEEIQPGQNENQDEVIGNKEENNENDMEIESPNLQIQTKQEQVSEQQ